MRVIAAVLLLAGSLVGCVSGAVRDRIEAGYQRCLDGGYRQGLCESVRDKGYENVKSLGFMLDPRCNADTMYDGCHGGGSHTAPVPVLILN